MFVGIVRPPLGENEEACSFSFYRQPDCSHEEEMELTLWQKHRNLELHGIRESLGQPVPELS